jgi:hypothetical protein
MRNAPKTAGIIVGAVSAEYVATRNIQRFMDPYIKRDLDRHLMAMNM